MPGKYLLDTNILIAHFNGEAAVNQRVFQAGEVFAPVVVIGEMFYGAAKSRKFAENAARIVRFTKKISILPCDTISARYYGELK